MNDCRSYFADQVADALRCLNDMAIVKVGIAGRGPHIGMTEQLTDYRQGFGMGGGMAGKAVGPHEAVELVRTRVIHWLRFELLSRLPRQRERKAPCHRAQFTSSEDKAGIAGIDFFSGICDDRTRAEQLADFIRGFVQAIKMAD